ncbi:pentapeptide repeat-containing protein (plasmid) [Sulfitobacter sp. W027]|uniref:pentapeptide repeat-containing protein n=1 Tax=Sulfitobacter sp. W027 TaxID=2867025 RepID=UPI0021A70BCE|nr:pentapeptide repeat-containing protein [Sulfitobacter sp. W027]UWR35577.1 pentapeptide repeat-containing protein [Sulfitobacter sp. W027]
MKNFVFSTSRLGVLLTVVSLFGTSAIGQEPDEEKQLRMLGKCPGCTFEHLDLTGRKLTGIDLTEAQLKDVDFSEAGLNLSLFDQATLENVSFDSADLTGASFTGAKLVNVSFENTVLKAAVFEDAILIDTDLDAGFYCNTQVPDETMVSTECD